MRTPRDAEGCNRSTASLTQSLEKYTGRVRRLCNRSDLRHGHDCDRIVMEIEGYEQAMGSIARELVARKRAARW